MWWLHGGYGKLYGRLGRLPRGCGGCLEDVGRMARWFSKGVVRLSIGVWMLSRWGWEAICRMLGGCLDILGRLSSVCREAV